MIPERPQIEHMNDVEAETSTVSTISIISIKNVNEERVSSPIPNILQRRNIAWEDNDNSNANPPNHENIDLSLEEQRQQNEVKANSRLRNLENIVLNIPTQVSWGKGLLYIAGSIIASVFCTIPFSALFPLHNHIFQPEYWYETIYTGYVFGSLLISIYATFVTDDLMNIQRKNKINGVILLFFTIWVVRSSLKTLLYFIWSIYLQYPFPMPLMGLIIVIASNLFCLLALWFQYPISWRKDPMFLDRFGCFVLLGLYLLGTALLYNVMGRLLLKSRDSYQPLVACTLPLLFKLHINVSTKLCVPVANGDPIRTKIVTVFWAMTHYSMFITIILGSITTFATGCTLMAIKLIMDISICLKIIWRRRNNPDINYPITLLQKLVLNEIMQFTVPLAYMLSLLVAYNGKNASLMGGIGSDMWQYNKIENINETLTSMLLFFFTDLISVLICSTLLWVTSRINFFKVVCFILNEFGLIFSILIGIMVSMVSFVKWP